LTCDVEFEGQIKLKAVEEGFGECVGDGETGDPVDGDKKESFGRGGEVGFGNVEVDGGVI